MKNFISIGISLSSLLFYFHLSSQSVIFSQSTEMLSPIAGFTSYSDCVVDMNQDYLDDIVRVGGKGVFIDYQQTNGTFIQRQFNFSLQTVPSWSICAGDIDNNGYNDLLFAHSSSVSFILANENGTDYHESLMPGFIESQRSTIADINNDGWLDGFVCNESVQSIPFRNQGGGIMLPDTNLIRTANLAGNYAAIWTDYDNDEDIDLYISKCLDGTLPGDPIRTNLLYRNNGDGTFIEVGAQAGIDDNAQSWSTAVEDFDNDGDFDAFVINHDFANRLFRNNGDGTFTDVIVGSGIDPEVNIEAFENSSGDFNNDGFMDIFSDLPFHLYLGNGDLTFIGQETPMKPGAIGDLNNDGFLDVMKSQKIWLNEGNDNHWVKINLLGTTSNRNGIGSRIEIYGSWGRQIREVRSGQSYSPMSSLTTHYGIGQSNHIDSLIVKWPSGIHTKWVDLNVDTTYLVTEASCISQTIKLNVEGKILICPDDSIIVNSPDGYVDYRWSNGDTNRTIYLEKEGIYFLIATDSIGCISISNQIEIQIIEENSPVISTENSIRFCEGNSITLTSSPGLNYSWSTGETLQQSIVVSQSGIYSVSVDAVCFNGQLTSQPINVNVLPSPSPVVSDVYLLPGDSILLEASGENLYWYDQPAGGTLLNIGSTFQTSSLVNNTTFYIESHHIYPGEFQTGGKTDTTGTGSMPLQNGYMYFETWEPVTLSSVTVYLPKGGPQGIRFIQLYSEDTLIRSKSFSVQTGKNVVDLNFFIPVGKHYITCPQGNLFRNAGTLDYPYLLGDVGSINGSSNGENFYYYFYDWKIAKPDIECISERIPVNVIVSGNENLMTNILRIYPNPTAQVLNIEISENLILGKLKIIDIFGRQIFNEVVPENKNMKLNVENYPGGMYLLEIEMNGVMYVNRFILE